MTHPTLRPEGWEKVFLRPQGLKQGQPSVHPSTLGLKLPAVLRTALTWPMELFSVSREAAFLFEWIFFAWGWTIQGEARLLRD